MATYESYATVAELLASISNILENSLLRSLKASLYFSLMEDESTDVASKEELSVCACWLQDSKPVEHFLGIVQAKETNAEAITDYLEAFCSPKVLDLRRWVGLAFMGRTPCQATEVGFKPALD